MGQASVAPTSHQACEGGGVSSPRPWVGQGSPLPKHVQSSVGDRLVFTKPAQGSDGEKGEV